MLSFYLPSLQTKISVNKDWFEKGQLLKIAPLKTNNADKGQQGMTFSLHIFSSIALD